MGIVVLMITGFWLSALSVC